MNQTFNAIKLNELDNVAVVLKNVEPGQLLTIKGFNEKILVMKNIPYGHKVATSHIRNNERIIKYGECMGISTAEILPGYHVHVFNVRGLKEEERYVNNEEHISTQ
ncbi:hypothetical protein ABE28_018925 [Peribacillus muralis]|uniref:SAF domain-containing protein n=1 Tax=Peribacillus muralis TaxID=264697 RepID=A0A1B3XT92_9BACI|nr:UxaA family hydrolase [Peribacillus muralis]AOH56446.1 hypothetical protein ABE28_018925 [Peribacillus muralis]